VDGKSVELSGNNENDFKAGAARGRGRLTVRSTSVRSNTCGGRARALRLRGSPAIEKHGNIAAVKAAHEVVAAFFQRRKLNIDRQKALQAGKEELADEIDKKLDELEEKEKKVREHYAKEAAKGPASNQPDADATPAATGQAKGSGSVYGAAFDVAASSGQRAAIDEDDFI